jgi:phage terminase large subunit-like protein
VNVLVQVLPLPQKRILNLPTDRKALLKLADELKERIEDLRQKQEEAKSLDPFWYYEPSDGIVTDEGLALLRKWLKEEDWPNGRLDCQKDVHLCTANVILDAGGNQGGKSTTGAIEGLIKATGEVPFSLKEIYPKEKIPVKFPNHVRVVGVDFPTFLKNILPAYQKWVPREYLVDGSWEKSYNSEGRVLKLGKKGSLTGTVEFMTNEQNVRSFQGPPRQKIIYDEEPRYDIYKENLMRFTTADRLDVLFCMTPTEGMSWVKEEILDKEDGKKIAAFKVPSITNKKANLEVLDDVLSGLGSYDEIKMRLLGEFVSLSGLVYGRLFNEKVHVIEPFAIGRTNDAKQSTDNRYNYFVVRGIDPHLVKPSACVELAVDREGNKYVVGCYLKDADTALLKSDLADRAKGYRLGWSIFDKSADSTIKVFGDRNIFLEMTRGKNAVPGAFKSEKFTGSIAVGVDGIKQDLKVDPKTKKPKLFIFDTPENRPLIQAMKNMERDTYQNEEEKGKKDRIKEGKWDLHACLRYIYQRVVRWIPPEEKVPEMEEERFI